MVRSREIKIRLTGDEHAELMRRRGKMRLATWIRTAALDGAPPTIPSINLDAMHNLQRIGNNINQLARRMNSGEDVHITDALAEINALRAALIGAVKK